MQKSQNHDKTQKTTTSQEEKKSSLLQKLTSHNPQAFRQIDISSYEMNVFQNFAELEYIDDLITPLIYVAHYGMKEICKFLLKNKRIDIDLQTETNRQTPLIIACMRGNYQIVRLLVLSNAEINKPNALNQSPLTAAIYRLADEPITFENTCICFRISEFLIDHGADVNWIVDKNRGYSLLHYFCSVRMKLGEKQKQLNFRIIKFLVQKGADLDQRTLKDQNVFNLVQKHCNKDVIVKFFQEFKDRDKEGNGNYSKIPKFNVKKLGEDYFKGGKVDEE